MYTLLDNFKHVLAFVRVAECRGFTPAAYRMGVSTAAVSKSVSLLEAELSIKLFNRTTRSLSLTDEGEILLERCRGILHEIETTEGLLTRTNLAPRGRLRIHAPVGMGRLILMPVLASLTERYPELVISADFSDRSPNIAEEGLDLMLVIGEISDSRVIAKPLTRLHYITCASPAYLKRHGVPRSPRELDSHNCLAYAQWQTGTYHTWNFQKGAQHYTFTPAGNLKINHPEAILDAVASGAGIARMASYIASPAILDGRLQPILKDWMPPGLKVQIVYLPNRNLSLRVKVLMDEIAQVLPEILPWEREIGLISPDE